MRQLHDRTQDPARPLARQSEPVAACSAVTIAAMCLLMATLDGPALAAHDDQAALAQRPPPDTIRRQVEQILAQDKYQTAEVAEPWWHEPLMKLLRYLGERIGPVVETRDALYSGYPVLYWTVVVVLAAALVGILTHLYLGLRGQFGAEPHRQPRGAPVSTDMPSDNRVARARRAASAGQFGQAIVWLYMAAIWHLDRRSLIAVSRADTNRQILHRLRDHPDLIATLGPLSEAVEAISYGGHRPTADEFDSALQLAEAVMSR